MKWPNLAKVDNVLKERDPEAIPLEERSSDSMSWFTGMILPGPTLPWLLMNTLVDCDDDVGPNSLAALTHVSLSISPLIQNIKHLSFTTQTSFLSTPTQTPNSPRSTPTQASNTNPPPTGPLPQSSAKSSPQNAPPPLFPTPAGSVPAVPPPPSPASQPPASANVARNPVSASAPQT